MATPLIRPFLGCTTRRHRIVSLYLYLISQIRRQLTNHSVIYHPARGERMSAVRPRKRNRKRCDRPVNIPQSAESNPGELLLLVLCPVDM